MEVHNYIKENKTISVTKYVLQENNLTLSLQNKRMQRLTNTITLSAL